MPNPPDVRPRRSRRSRRPRRPGGDLPARLLLLATLACGLGLGAGDASGQQVADDGFTVDDLLDVERVDLAALSDDGRWAVVRTATLRDRLGGDNYRYGDPTYVAPAEAEVALVGTREGTSRPLPVDGTVRRAVFSPDGSLLALMVQTGEAIGVHVLRNDDGVLEPWRTARIPDDRWVSHHDDLSWAPDGSALYVSTRAPSWATEARAEFGRLTEGPVVVQSSDEDFLAWEALRRRADHRALQAWDVGVDAWRTVIPDTVLAGWNVLPDGRLLWEQDITEETSYERIFGSDETVRLLDPASGAERVVVEDDQELSPTWSEDRSHYAFVRDGDVSLASVDDEEPTRLTGEDREDGEGGEDEEDADSDAGAADEDEEEEGRWSVLAVGPRGVRVLAARGDDWYLLEPGTADPRLVLERPDEDDEPRRPVWRVEAWVADGERLLLSRESRTEWRRALVALDAGDGTVDELLTTEELLDDVTLSRDGSTVVFASGPGNRPLDLYAADAELDDRRRLTRSNPDLDPASLADTELFSYLDVDGRELYGIIYYPPGYEPGEPRPTVFNVYEQFFDDTFDPTTNVLTSHGYVVVRPSVHLERGYPGEAWMKGVTAAANELIRRGIADPDRLGVHGTSYGGYAVNLLVAQTDRFAAAINISGKVDMISFYTDSPRLGVRNIHAPERSQDRIGATLWEQPHKYVAHSAIMMADRIDTPLLLVTGRQDHNVPERTTMEMFYALRRLDRTVEWVSYVDGGHGVPTTDAAMVRDYHDRIVGWYDRWLRPDVSAETR